MFAITIDAPGIRDKNPRIILTVYIRGKNPRIFMTVYNLLEQLRFFGLLTEYAAKRGSHASGRLQGSCRLNS